MSVSDAPQWLLSAFVRSAIAVGATAPREDIEQVSRRLIERWQQPDRTFHNLRHLKDVLARVEELAEETHRPDAVRLAAWYHGAVFDAAADVTYARRGGEDEVASAALAHEELGSLGVPPAVCGRVHDLIKNLRRHDADEQDVDALALCDADLGTLAVEPQRYASYRKAVRAEYAHIPEPDYLESRITIVTRLLARRRLFVSPFSLAWEEPARENLTAELSHLRARLSSLVAGTAPDLPVGQTPASPARRGTHDGGAVSVTPSGPRSRPGRRPGSRSASEADDAATSAATSRSAEEVTGIGLRSAEEAPAVVARPGDDAASAASPTEADETPAPTSPTEADKTSAGASPTEADEAPATTSPTEVDPAGPDASQYGIEREPDLGPRRRSERRSRRQARRERAAPPPEPDDDDSTGSLFRPPPNLPRT